MKHITAFARFRILARKLNEQVGAVEARGLDRQTAEIVKTGVDALVETNEFLMDFVELPHITPLFDKFAENRE